MTDIFDEIKRSSVMRKVRSRGNKTTKLLLINSFKQYNISGWRRFYDVKGHPDFVFRRRKLTIFVDGCFWHGHNCRNFIPQNNKDYWEKENLQYFA